MQRALLVVACRKYVGELKAFKLTQLLVLHFCLCYLQSKGLLGSLCTLSPENSQTQSTGLCSSIPPDVHQLLQKNDSAKLTFCLDQRPDLRKFQFELNLDVFIECVDL